MITWTNIKSVGYIGTESSIKKADGTVQLKSFLNSFVREFAIQCAGYINFTKEPPFYYGERQLPSIICPGLARYADALLAELPVNRRWSGIKNKDYEDAYGWVDYWCSYRNLDFFMEVKHGFDNLRTDAIRIDIINNWAWANEQLKVIKKHAKSLCLSSRGLFLLAMHIIPFYETLKSKKDIVGYDYEEDLLSRQQVFMQLKPLPNWSSVWMLNEALANKCIYQEKEVIEYYPGVLFLAKASDLIYV